MVSGTMLGWVVCQIIQILMLLFINRGTVGEAGVYMCAYVCVSDSGRNRTSEVRLELLT